MSITPRQAEQLAFRSRLHGRLRALTLFMPGVVVVILLHVLFIQLEQGRDIVRQTFESPSRSLFLGFATVFLAYGHLPIGNGSRGIRTSDR
jgi:ABC-type spermidine/putrescine transport system permease subunit II